MSRRASKTLACAGVLACLVAPRDARAQAWLVARGVDLQERQVIHGTVEANAYGYGSLLGRSAAGASWTEEGARARLLGYLWLPRVAQVDLGLEAFAVQQIRRQGFAPGRRLGFDARLQILPASILPLTLRASSRETALSTRTLPGQRYGTRTLGLTWRLVAPGVFPRLWLRLDQQNFALHTDSILSPDRTGLARGQDFAGRRRIGRLDLAQDDEHTHLRATYEIEERVDDSANQLTGGVDRRRLVIESASLSGRADPSTALSISLFGDLRSTRDASFDSRRYLASAHARFQPDERTRAVGAYTFQGDTLFGTTHHLARLDGYLKWNERFEGVAGLQASQQSYGRDAPVQSLSSQSMTLGGYYRDHLGPAKVSATELLSAGISQANPGEAGLLLRNALSGQVNLPVARRQLVYGDAGVLEAIDRSSFGIDQTQVWLGGHWVGSYGRGVSGFSDLTFLRERRLDRFLGRDPERRTRLDLRVGAFRRVSRVLRLSATGGWALATSSLDDRVTNTPYLNVSLGWRPRRRLSIDAQLQWQSYLYAGYSRSTVEARGDVLWRVRSLEFDLSYRLRFSDAIGVRDLSHVFILSAKRRFGAGL